MTYDLTYQKATSPPAPTGGPAPGTIALAEFLMDEFDGSWSKGIYNPRKIAGTLTWSTHAEGRGFDLGVNRSSQEGLDIGNAVSDYLVEHCAALGVQYFIWNRRSFRPTRDPQWKRYGGLSPHRDHLHIEQTRTAAIMLSREDIPMATKIITSIVDEESTASEPGRIPFWTVYSNGAVISQNNARPVNDVSHLNLVAPITGAMLYQGRLLLVADGDGGAFHLEF